MSILMIIKFQYFWIKEKNIGHIYKQIRLKNIF